MGAARQHSTALQHSATSINFCRKVFLRAKAKVGPLTTKASDETLVVCIGENVNVGSNDSNL